MGHWLSCGASGVVGYGIGGAMAARLLFPRRRVALLSGDGSSTFNLTDLECAARQRLPFLMVAPTTRAGALPKSAIERATARR